MFLPELGPVSLLVEEGNGPIHAIMACEVMLPASVVEKRNDQGHQSYGDRRVCSGLSFYCLRPSLSSFLGNSGASQGVAGDIVGNDSEAMTGHYTKFDLETRHAAIAKLPTL